MPPPKHTVEIVRPTVPRPTIIYSGRSNSHITTSLAESLMSAISIGSNNSRASAHGTWTVRALGARGLAKAFLDGTTGPYLSVTQGKVRFKTAVDTKGAVDPKWDETFAFHVSSRRADADTVLFQVKNKKISRCSSIIGAANVKLVSLCVGDRRLVIPLKAPGSRLPAGELDVSVKFEPYEEPDAPIIDKTSVHQTIKHPPFNDNVNKCPWNSTPLDQRDEADIEHRDNSDGRREYPYQEGLLPYVSEHKMGSRPNDSSHTDTKSFLPRKTNDRQKLEVTRLRNSFGPSPRDRSEQKPRTRIYDYGYQSDVLEEGTYKVQTEKRREFASNIDLEGWNEDSQHYRRKEIGHVIEGGQIGRNAGKHRKKRTRDRHNDYLSNEGLIGTTLLVNRSNEEAAEESSCSRWPHRWMCCGSLVVPKE